MVLESNQTLSEHFLKLGIQAVLCSECVDKCLIKIVVRAKPGSKREKISIGDSGEIVMAFAVRPVEGAANKAIVKILAQNLGLSASSILLERGEKSKSKVFEVSYFFTEHKNITYYKKKLSYMFGDPSFDS